MKRRTLAWMGVCVGCGSPKHSPPPPDAAGTVVTVYVALDGNDAWSGRLPDANAAGTDGPFATLEHARAFVAALDKTGLTEIDVELRGGTYYLPQTQMFGSADSGTAATPIVYEAYQGEKPVISGGIRVTGWTNTGGNTWVASLPTNATAYFENLYYNGERRLRPRLGGYLDAPAPLRVAATYYAAQEEPNCPTQIASKLPGPSWECFDRFYYAPNPLITDAWKNLAPPQGNACNTPKGDAALVGDIELLDFEQFSTSRLRISCVDTANSVIYLTGPTAAPNGAHASEAGYIPNHRYIIENVQDALALPGQWFLDRSTAPWMLTYLAKPGEDPNTDTVVVPQLPHVVMASNLSYVTFRGLAFAHDNFTVPATGLVSVELEPTVSAAVSFQNSQHLVFDGNTVSETAGAGLEIISCTGSDSPAWCVANDPNAATSDITVENSAFYDLGTAGIRVGEQGSPQDSDANVPQSIVVDNNVIAGYGRVSPAAFGIGQGMGHDNLYTHNDVYDGYHCAISISENLPDGRAPSGNGAFNNTISFNHVHDVLQGIMNDGGAVRIEDGNLAFTSTGNKIVNNRIHDVTDAGIQDADGYGGHGIYLDNQSGVVDVENNLVYRVSAAAVYTPHGPALTANGGPNTIKNNIFAFARLAMVQSGDPYQNGVPATPIQEFVITNNLFYFDRDGNSTSPFQGGTVNAPFRVQGGCSYSPNYPATSYTAFQQFTSNMYFRAGTTNPFGGKNSFHVQTTAGTGANAPCDNDPTLWTMYSFAEWTGTGSGNVGEDAGSVIQDPGFQSLATDDYSLPNGSPGVGFVVFDATQAGRTNPLIVPPAVAPTFAVQMYSVGDY